MSDEEPRLCGKWAVGIAPGVMEPWQPGVKRATEKRKELPYVDEAR